MSAIKSRKISQIVHFFIACLFIFGFRYLPPIGSITPWGMETIGIFIGILYGWSTSNKVWPSLLGIVALGYLDGQTVFGTLGISFSDNLVLTTLFFFCFSAIVENTGLSKFIANWCISRKFASGRPYIIVLMFTVAALLVSAFVNLFASMLLLTIIFGKFCSEAGFKTGDAYPAYGTIVIIVGSTVGGGIFPFMGQSYVVNSVMKQITGAQMDFVVFTIIQIILAIITIAVVMLLYKYVFKPDVSILLKDGDRFACYRDDKMTSEQKQVFCLIILLMLLLFLPGILPDSWMITAFLSNLDVPGAAVLTIAIYYIINLGKPAEDIISFPTLAKGINWDLILMFATIAPLVAAVNNEKSNIMPYVVSLLDNILGGMSPVLFIIVGFFIAMSVSQFINNVAIVLAFMPIMFAFGETLNVNPLVLSIIASYILNISFCTPTASGNAAYIFSYKQWITSKQALKGGLAVQTAAFAITIISTPIILSLY